MSMHKRLMAGVSLWAFAMMAPEDGGAAGAAAAAAGAGTGAGAGAADPASGTAAGAADAAASVLFPNDGKAADAGKTGDAGETGNTGDAPAWKPYADDPAKSAEDNAKAKADHELANPDNPLNKVPEDGKYTLAAPEGMQVDEALATAISPVLKDLGLTQGQAQKLADAFGKEMAARATQQNADWTATNDAWVKSAKGDKEIGGANWDASVKTAQTALAKFGTADLRNFLQTSGGGNHPEVIRFMTRVGQAISEDKPATGSSGGNGTPAEAAYVLFPNDVRK